MTLELISYLIITLGAVQGIILSFYLLGSKQGNRKANQLLGWILLFFSLNMAIPGVLHYFHEELPHLLASGFPLMFLFGPGIFFYTLFIIKKRGGYKKQDLLHLMPFAISLVLTIPIYLESAEAKVAILKEWQSGNLQADILTGWALECLHLSVYLVLSFISLKQYSFKVRSVHSSLEKLNLDWLKHLILAKTVVWAAYFVLFLLFLTGLNGELFNYVFFVFALSVSYLTYSIGYKALKQPELFGIDGYDVKIKYEKSGLSNSMITIYEQQLIQLMESKKPYLEPDLKLPDLAEMLEMPSNYLSQVINEKLGQNFFDFINSFRIEEVKDLLSDPEHRDRGIMEVAYSVGFSSKSTFNIAFKKFAHSTPSAFRNKTMGNLPLTLTTDS